MMVSEFKAVAKSLADMDVIEECRRDTIAIQFIGTQVGFRTTFNNLGGRLNNGSSTTAVFLNYGCRGRLRHRRCSSQKLTTISKASSTYNLRIFSPPL